MANRFGASFETVEEALAWARAALAGVAESEPLDASLLLMHVLGVDRAALIAHPERTLTPEQSAAYRDLIERRAAGVPLPYLTGRRAFYDLELIVTQDVLIPRPETEHLVESALVWARERRGLRVVDVGTGSGAIAVALARHLPDTHILALDISAAALAVARQNAARYGMLERIEFVLGDLLTPLLDRGQQADLIAANLPYIISGELDMLAVARYEPRLALDGGPDGLGLIRRLLGQAPRALAAGGLLLLEIGAGQGERVRALAETAFPGVQVHITPDYARHERVVSVERGS
ncbi:MAG TPA: peptide chain release factor N(5)-glutamine methyltransferase [Aggregatilineaceae bacterium]|nr:peptide chain release factor N(5)-glutamine methyltransferase [Aggregatilineaceae bacterium]